MVLLILILEIRILCRELKGCLGSIGVVLLLVLFFSISSTCLILSMTSLSLTSKIEAAITASSKLVAFATALLDSLDHKQWLSLMQLDYLIVIHLGGVKE